ncbi:hypothetical protein ECE50_025475 [Chitinophaga sp. Mgbs1]|uniref:Uncharacterized protein n=1 Tax=Chitinophaga solisilvae TaxID=1233460 RepID=A0A3S1D3J8_9BACT|nr:hypothetical protein [Chitinophaga solisilvae]
MVFEGHYYHMTSADVMRFTRDGNAVEWKGAGWQKLGTWSLITVAGKTLLEFRYNYAREERYVVTVLQLEEGIVTAFRLEDVSGRGWEFRREL